MNTRPRINQAAAVLWASAFVIAALIIIQGGRLAGPTADAAMAVNQDPYTLITVDSGRGGDTDPNELLYVINSREGVMMVYEIEDARQRNVLLRDGGRLEALFQAAP